MTMGGMNPAADDMGRRIRRARERRRWTQRQLAGALHVDRKTVDNWENGRTSPRSSIGAIEEVLGIRLSGEPEEPEAERSPLDELVGEEDAEEVRRMVRRKHPRDADYWINLIEDSVSQPPGRGGPGRESGQAPAR